MITLKKIVVSIRLRGIGLTKKLVNFVKILTRRTIIVHITSDENMEKKKVLLHIVLQFLPRALLINSAEINDCFIGEQYTTSMGNRIDIVHPGSGCDVNNRYPEINGYISSGSIRYRQNDYLGASMSGPFLVATLDQFKDIVQHLEGKAKGMKEYKDKDLKIEFEQRVEGNIKTAIYKLVYAID